MTTHVSCIYHCISCGRIVHAELELKQPQCCGHPMTNACTELGGESDVVGDNVGGNFGTGATVGQGSRKAT